jgi:hypothetical protein
MEDVFASAYCTIAVTFAKDDQGFLHRSFKESVRLGDSALCAYVGEVSKSFDQDVQNGELSKRGWVLQE